MASQELHELDLEVLPWLQPSKSGRRSSCNGQPPMLDASALGRKPLQLSRLQLHTAASSNPSCSAEIENNTGTGTNVRDVLGAAAEPWWMVLPDFVPVEVLVQQQVNPRDGCMVHINYKSQFKDGQATPAPRGRVPREAAPRSSRKRRAPSTAGRRKAAANAAAVDDVGFVPARSLAAAAQFQTPKVSSGRKKQSRRKSSTTGPKASRGRSVGVREPGSGRRTKQGGSGGKYIEMLLAGSTQDLQLFRGIGRTKQAAGTMTGWMTAEEDEKNKENKKEKKKEKKEKK
eukprot:gene11324-11474_t